MKILLCSLHTISHSHLSCFSSQKSLSSDNKIAWTQIPLPDSMRGDQYGQIDDWWPLSGNLGADNEGNIHVVISKKVTFY